MKARTLFQLLTFALLPLLLFQCQKSEEGNEEQQQAQTSTQVSLDCAHCGMPSQEYPKWQVKAHFPNNDTRFFCSPKCFFFYQQKQNATPDSALVVDFYSAERIDALSSYYITGSDVLGPMGKDLVPVEGKQAAEEFSADHGGKRILEFTEVDAEAMKEL